MLAAILVISGSIIFLFENIFRLRKLNIISPFVDRTIAGAFDTQYTFLMNPLKIKKNILQNKLWQDANVRIVNHSTVEVQLLAKKPSALVEIHNMQILISSDGTPIPLSITEWSGLPEIEAQFLTEHSKENEDWRVKKAAEIILELDKVGLEALNITIEQKNSIFIVKISEGTEIVVPQSISPSELAASLQIIIGRFKIEGKTVTKIDFQSDKPVIILSSQTKSSIQ